MSAFLRKTCPGFFIDAKRFTTELKGVAHSRDLGIVLCDRYVDSLDPTSLLTEHKPEYPPDDLDIYNGGGEDTTTVNIGGGGCLSV